MVCFPNVKTNLGPSMVSKRSDGYHNMETIFYPIPVRDALETAVPDRTYFTQTGIPVDAPQKRNPVIKALNVLKARYEIPPLEIRLLKAIPFGAGLGGDSADAAFMLKLINDFCGLDIYSDELEAITSTIGADYPLFICNTPIFAAGTGDQLESVNLSLKDYYLCLVKSDVAIFTPEACSMVIPAAPETSLKEIIQLPVSKWKERMMNNFKRSVPPKHPVAERIEDTLYKGGALYTAMSGSGPSVSGLFEKPTYSKERPLFNDCFLWEG